MVQVRLLVVLLLMLLMLETGLRELRLSVGAEATRRGLHRPEAPVTVLHRAQNVGH